VDRLTHLLHTLADGSAPAPAAASELLPLVYEELRLRAARKLAAERPGHTLQPTALVHEAYLRVANAHPPNGYASRAHFFAPAAEAMRHILIDNARRRLSLRRGGDRHSLDSPDALASVAAPTPDTEDNDDQLVALDAALARLESEDKPKADLVKLHYFVGLSLEDAAEALGVSRATAYRHWTYARAYLRHEVRSAATPNSS
jgi:RNA polymerase sigma factor (TIGR02999 family)